MDCYSWLYTLIIQVCPSLEWQEMTSCHRKISIFLHSYSLQLSCCICGFFVSPNFSSLTLKSEVPHGSQPIHWKKYKASGFGFCIDSRIVTDGELGNIYAFLWKSHQSARCKFCWCLSSSVDMISYTAVIFTSGLMQDKYQSIMCLCLSLLLLTFVCIIARL